MDYHDYHLNKDYKNKYKIIKKLGKGEYTEVYKVENINTKELRAMKIIKLEDIRQKLENGNIVNDVNQTIKYIISDIKNEIKNMKICGEKNINSIKFYEAFETENELIIVLELCDYSLTNRISQKNKNFYIDEINEIINQLNNTFKIMDKNYIIHRNLKPNNILLKKVNNKNIIKICDYGLSKIGKYIKLEFHKGTNEYLAPEILKVCENISYKCDLWSLGIIIYELYFKERPYRGENDNIILEKIEKYGKLLLKKTDNKLFNNLIDKLLEKDSNKRISWDYYFNHPFFKNNEMTIIYDSKKEIEIKIFGDKFIANNKEKCIIKYKEKEYTLQEFQEIKKGKWKIEIKLIETDIITDMSYMFSDCAFLETIVDISKWNTYYVTDMSYLFSGCEHLKSLPDISKWKTNNVVNMSYMFSGCKSLTSLPDIAIWNTNNVTNMSYMFEKCELLDLPDLRKWNTDKVTDMTKMFDKHCFFTSKNFSKFNSKEYII